jgi:hypothetical protein
MSIDGCGAHPYLAVAAAVRSFAEKPAANL